MPDLPYDLLLRLQLPLEAGLSAGVGADHGFSIVVQPEAQCSAKDST